MKSDDSVKLCDFRYLERHAHSWYDYAVRVAKLVKGLNEPRPSKRLGL